MHLRLMQHTSVERSAVRLDSGNRNGMERGDVHWWEVRGIGEVLVEKSRSFAGMERSMVSGWLDVRDGPLTGSFSTRVR